MRERQGRRVRRTSIVARRSRPRFDYVGSFRAVEGQERRVASPQRPGMGKLMMFITKCRCPAGRFCAAWVQLALPFLESMVPALDRPRRRRPIPSAGSASSSCRSASGPGSWTPTMSGAGFELSPILKPLEPFRNQMTWSRICASAGRPRRHRSAAWLTGTSEADDRRRRARGHVDRSGRRASRLARTRCFRRSSWRPRISPATSAAATAVTPART